MSEKRITPEEVVEAYQKTGLKPTRYDIAPYLGKCCGMGAIVALRAPETALHYGWADREYGRDYVNGFIQGFDGSERPPVTSDRSRYGWEDGKAAAERVFAEVVG